MESRNDKEVILRISGITKHFGGLAAVSDVDLHFGKGSTTGIVGPNGSGKTTLFNVITGYLQPTKGEVFFENRNITGLRAHEIVNRGIVRTFQVPQCCRALTVEENIRLACLGRYHEKELDQKVSEFAGLAGLGDILDRQTGNLPIGHLRRIEIAMAVATRPKMILLDEPFSGLTDAECEETSSLIKELTGKLTLALIDHKLKHLMPLVDDIIVLNQGTLFYRGNPVEVSRSPDVQRIYIGGEIEQ